MITSSDLHLNNIKKWTIDDSVKQKVEEMGFGFLVKLREKLLTLTGDLSLPLHIINALVNNYNVETECFVFENGANVVHLDFGLQDILYITGLPINGMAVSGNVRNNSVEVVETNLDLERNVAEDFLKGDSKIRLKGGVDPKKLLAHFESPGIGSTADAGIRAKAFVFYCFANVLFPSRSRICHPYYLPLLGEMVKNYAWGTTVLAHIKNDLAYIVKDGGKSNMCCFSLALTVFALERFPCLTQEKIPNLPTDFPLSLGWIDVIAKQFNTSIKRKTVEQLQIDIMENIKWMPYSSDRLQVPRDIEDQLILRYVVVPCINFFQVHMVRPDLCYRQLG